VSSTDEDVVRQLDRLLKVGTVYGPYHASSMKGTKPVWLWHLHGKRALVLMRKLRPYMSRRRVARIDDFLSGRGLQ